jgi:hypothetical protein
MEIATAACGRLAMTAAWKRKGSAAFGRAFRYAENGGNQLPSPLITSPNNTQDLPSHFSSCICWIG